MDVGAVSETIRVSYLISGESRWVCYGIVINPCAYYLRCKLRCRHVLFGWSLLSSTTEPSQYDSPAPLIACYEGYYCGVSIRADHADLENRCMERRGSPKTFN
jgi:hypothetical protein